MKCSRSSAVVATDDVKQRSVLLPSIAIAVTLQHTHRLHANGTRAIKGTLTAHVSAHFSPVLRLFATSSSVTSPFQTQSIISDEKELYIWVGQRGDMEMYKQEVQGAVMRDTGWDGLVYHRCDAM